MKKSIFTQRTDQGKNHSKSLRLFKFNLSQQNLACFKDKHKMSLGKLSLQSLKQSKLSSQIKSSLTSRQRQTQQEKYRNRTISSTSSFNEQVVIMTYDNQDVYIDKSNNKQRKIQQSQNSQKQKIKSLSSSSSSRNKSVEKLLTQQKKTQATSNLQSFQSILYGNIYLSPQNTISIRNQSTSRSIQNQSSANYNQQYYTYINYPNYYFCQNYQTQLKGRGLKNKCSVINQQNNAFIINQNNIQKDGRTTVMVKNIPNKYTQQMLIQQITTNYQNKFDFFYLPIDKQNNCNVGYAFVNFLNTSYLKHFYKQFEGKKWKNYRSPKICNICYARYQGTLQLAQHFKHTKIINQKDRKIRPLIGVAQTNILKKMIKNQRKE